MARIKCPKVFRFAFSFLLSQFFNGVIKLATILSGSFLSEGNTLTQPSSLSDVAKNIFSHIFFNFKLLRYFQAVINKLFIQKWQPKFQTIIHRDDIVTI